MSNDGGASEVGIGDLLRDRATGKVKAVGYVQRTPKPKLSNDDGETQRDLFHALQARGVPVRDQGGVYPYLMRQIGSAIGAGVPPVT
ncbi:MAG TPA: hypothetical protein VF796_18515 [Humisphaera sp.]